jgi:hypothetical protein
MTMSPSNFYCSFNFLRLKIYVQKTLNGFGNPQGNALLLQNQWGMRKDKKIQTFIYTFYYPSYL